jgi:hypothetical protein
MKASGEEAPYKILYIVIEAQWNEKKRLDDDVRTAIFSFLRFHLSTQMNYFPSLHSSVFHSG